MFLGPDGKVLPEASTLGWRAVAVPSTVAGLALAHERYGSMRWKDLVEPARKLAADGFPLTHTHVVAFERKRTKLARFPEARRIFLRDGKPYAEGEIFKQPELAATLERLAKNGPREFATGETARRIAVEMEENGGLVTAEDLARYQPVERPPVRGTYRGYDVVSMPPPSSGGTVLVEMLQTLEHFDVRGFGFGSSSADHLLVETMRRAFADRATLFGDPEFVRVPVDRLVSREYAAKLARAIDLEHATPSADVHAGLPAPEPLQTTHYTVVDGKGNAVANTYTLNGSFGSCVMAKGTGFLLNNEMDDFAARPGGSNQFLLVQGEANAIAPGKRPLSSMSPTILVKDGKLAMALGSQGGPTIITQVLQVIVNVIDHGMNLQQAVDAPRLHHQWMPDIVYTQPYGMPADVREALRAHGHQRFETYPDLPYLGDVQAVMVDPESGWLLGASDSRNPNGRSVGD
jgi:gamma-glutamyltranspeptidase/glutathione hydrolase